MGLPPLKCKLRKGRLKTGLQDKILPHAQLSKPGKELLIENLLGRKGALSRKRVRGKSGLGGCLAEGNDIDSRNGLRQLPPQARRLLEKPEKLRTLGDDRRLPVSTL